MQKKDILKKKLLSIIYKTKKKEKLKNRYKNFSKEEKDKIKEKRISNKKKHYKINK